MYLAIKKRGTFARERLVPLTSVFRLNSDSIKVYSRTVFLDGCTYSELVKHEEFIRRKNRG